MSAMPSFVAPADAAASKICRISSSGVRPPSTRTRSATAPRLRVYSTVSTVSWRVFSLDLLSLHCKFKPL